MQNWQMPKQSALLLPTLNPYDPCSTGYQHHCFGITVGRAARDEQFLAILTESLLSETMSVLAHDKFAEQLAVRHINLENLTRQYRAAAEIVEAAEVPAGVVRDPKDVAILACAVGGKADYIVSGDKDLLTLVNYEGISILTAEQFLNHLSNP